MVLLPFVKAFAENNINRAVDAGVIRLGPDRRVGRQAKTVDVVVAEILDGFEGPSRGVAIEEEEDRQYVLFERS